MTDFVATPSSAADHPEEMRASVSLRWGDRAAFDARARTTPAGLIAVGVAVAGILLAAAVIVRAARSEARWRRF